VLSNALAAEPAAWSCRAARRDELDAIVVLGRSSSSFQRVLAYQYPTFDAFIAHVTHPDKGTVVCVCADAQGAIAGWALCFPFHERSGYAGAAQLAYEMHGAAAEGPLALELWRVCEAECLKHGLTTIIGYACAGAQPSTTWYRTNGFRQCGELELDGPEKLELFVKGLST
jgi:L-amino acid N-acyltransferase YncA